jgi:hypothetical protein
MGITSSAPIWNALNPSIAPELRDARLQLHYAAQFATALGISYLAQRPDDSHTNLGWDPGLEALRSRDVNTLSHAVCVAVRPRDLSLIVLIDGSIGQPIPLHGSTIPQAEAGLRSALATAGLDGRKLTLGRHYDLPPHPVAGGEPFDASRSNDFAELAHWFGNAATVLEALRSRSAGSEVRCWPHHFDIATLATVAPGRTCGAGMLPGDAMFPEPYYYVNAYPRPDDTLTSTPLHGGGVWNTEDWFGAVLTASRLSPDPAAQAAQVGAFLDSTVAICSAALTGLTR